MSRLFSPENAHEKPEALKGVRVLDFTHVVFGPTVTKLLALFGAEVIKVEEPAWGDMFRMLTYWGRYWKHSNPIFHFLNQNKYFIAINLKHPKARELVYELVKKCDIVAENFAPGTADAWGIGYRQLSGVNPRIIYISCSTYGQYGPLRFFPGWDLIAQAVSGAASVTGWPEIGRIYKLPDYIGDFLPGMMGFVAVLMALHARSKTGEGQYIDLSQAEALMRLLFHYTYHSITGEELGPTGNFDPTMAPSGILKTGDGRFVAIAVATDEQFGALCSAMGKEELAKDKRFSTALERLKPENAKEVNDIVEGWVRGMNIDDIIKLAKEHGFAAAEVMDDFSIVNDPWRRERGSVVEVFDKMYGRFLMAGPPVMLSETPGRTKWLARPIGYHNRYVLKELLSLSDEEIKKLEEEGVIGYWYPTPGRRPPIYYDIERDPVFKHGRPEVEGV